MSLKRLGVALALALAAAPAHAHTGDGMVSHSHLVMGLLHPLGGPDHMIAMVTVGLLAALLGSRALWMLPAVFIAMMIVGAAIGLCGVEIPAAEIGIATSVVVLGAIVASGRPWPLAAATVLTGLFAIIHGYAHGAEMPAGTSTFVYGIGFVLATALLHGAGVATGLAAQGQRRIIRIAGGAAAGAGLVFSLV